MKSLTKTSLVIMAAGVGSRYGNGIKQLEIVGPNGELIMDYAIRDALNAGFNEVVFILRKEIEDEFKERIGNRLEEKIGKDKVHYVFQNLEDLPKEVSSEVLLEGREKPWGTGQAILACKEILDCPFAVINADDYYGTSTFLQMHDYLIQNEEELHYCMSGFILKNTLSENGAVTRGICEMDDEGFLTNVVETQGIIKTECGALANGVILNPHTHVSMNMWGLKPEFLDYLEIGFVEFLKNLNKEDKKSEYLLPTMIGDLLQQKKIKVKVLETKETWLGITYKEDKEYVVECFKDLDKKQSANHRSVH